MNLHISALIYTFIVNTLMFALTLDLKDLRQVKLYDFLVFSFFNASNLIVIIIALFTFKNLNWFRTPHKGIFGTGV